MTITHTSEQAWFNGEIVAREQAAPSVASISFHLGTGVFDGMMAYRNGDHYYVHRAEEHLERFRRGAARMGLMLRWSVAELLAGIEALLAVEPAGTQYVRPIAYRRGPQLWVTGDRGRPVDVCVFTVRVERDIDTAVACEISSIERISGRCIPAQTKVSGAYVNSFYARARAEEGGFDDGIMLDRSGRIAEASAANVFVIRGDMLLTPALNPDVFPGITRVVVLEIAKRLGIPCAETELRAADLDNAEGVFLCSTLMEIRAVNRLGTRQLATAQLPSYSGIIAEFRRLTHQ